MIAKTIKSILAGNVALTTLVPATRIFPLFINENTPLPSIVYSIESVSPEYNKGGWANDDIGFSVVSVSKDYTQLQTIAMAVRTALELNRTGSGSQSIGNIYMISMEEGYILEADAFFNKLNFKVITNKY